MREQQLTHLARVAIVGELSGGLAHELNQPLTFILSNAQATQHALSQGNVNAPPANEESTAQPIIAVVDDDASIRKAWRRLRRAAGFGSRSMNARLTAFATR